MQQTKQEVANLGIPIPYLYTHAIALLLVFRVQLLLAVLIFYMILLILFKILMILKRLRFIWYI